MCGKSVKIMLLLAHGERNVSELCDDLGSQSQPAVSHHLALLRHGKLVEPRRDGKHNYYDLTDEGRELADVVRPFAPSRPSLADLPAEETLRILAEKFGMI